MLTITDCLQLFPNNQQIIDAAIKTEEHLREHEKVMVSISGGADSDIMIDIVERIGYQKGRVTYVWFDTGLEYEATKRHIAELERKYGVTIERHRPIKAIPTAVREYGVPFMSKSDAEFIYRLQKHEFDFSEDISFEAAMEKYHNCKKGLMWWYGNCSERWRASSHVGLVEFMRGNAPPKISGKCCEYAKKGVSKHIERERGFDLVMTGERQAEGGVRALKGTCFTQRESRADKFRPLYWMSDADKQQYKEHCGVTYSDCYEVWGFKRTGCACCPFGSKFEDELVTVRQHELKLAIAAENVFGASYDYTRRYRVFRDAFKREKRRYGQLDLFDAKILTGKEG